MKNLIVITGPTACGKTPVAIALAKIIGGEIVSADSKQIYRGMDIGTAKPTLAERDGVPHHLLDIVDPTEDFNAAIFGKLAQKAIDNIKNPILAGGTGFYINAAIYENALDRPVGESLKLRYNTTTIILNRDRALLYKAIDLRVEEMFVRGLAKEVEKLLAAGVKEESTAMQALGYKEIVPYLKGQCTLEEAKAAICQKSRHYAKRQLTWFRHQVQGRWLSMDNITPQEAAAQIAAQLRQEGVLWGKVIRI